MKKTLAILSVFILFFSLCSCSNSHTQTTTSSSSTQASKNTEIPVDSTESTTDVSASESTGGSTTAPTEEPRVPSTKISATISSTTKSTTTKPPTTESHTTVSSPTKCSHPEWERSKDLFDMENHYDLCELCQTKVKTYPHSWFFSPEKSIKSECNPSIYSFECYMCTKCGLDHLDYLGEGHIYGEQKLLTEGCTNSGPRYERVCQRCGGVEQTVDENGERGHCYGSKATCFMASYCHSCGEKIADKLEHAGGTATCTSGPICIHCGFSYGSSLGGHKGGTATCTSGAICDICGSEYTEALGHRNTYVTGQVEPTCCNGYTGDTHCSDCGVVNSGTSIPPAYEHTWVEISRTQTATEWIVVSQCSNCGSTSTVSIKFG